MRKHYQLLTLAAGILFGVSAWAQDPQQPPAAQNPQMDGNSKTIVGCLTKGNGDSPYTVADSKTGEKVSFNAPDKIETFLNQTVQLMGQETTQGGQKTFVPQAVRTVSTSCQK